MKIARSLIVFSFVAAGCATTPSIMSAEDMASHKLTRAGTVTECRLPTEDSKTCHRFICENSAGKLSCTDHPMTEAELAEFKQNSAIKEKRMTEFIKSSGALQHHLLASQVPQAETDCDAKDIQACSSLVNYYSNQPKGSDFSSAFDKSLLRLCTLPTVDCLIDKVPYPRETSKPPRVQKTNVTSSLLHKDNKGVHFISYSIFE